MTSNTKWITKKASATRAGVGLRTINNWLAIGKLSKHKDGRGRVWIDSAELDDLLRPVLVTVDSTNR